MSATDTFQATLLQEFLLEDGLRQECNLAEILSRLGEIVHEPAAMAFDHFLSGGLIDFVAGGLTRSMICQLVQVKTTTLLVLSTADLLAWCKSAEDNYRSCCRSALCHAVQGSYDWAFGALRGAASRNDTWARHHHLYGLIHGARRDFGQARAELERAHAAEPHPDARLRIEEAIGLAQSAS